MASDNASHFYRLKPPHSKMNARSDCSRSGILHQNRGLKGTHYTRMQIEMVEGTTMKIRDVPSDVDNHLLYLQSQQTGIWCDFLVKLCPIGDIFLEMSNSYFSPDCDVRTWPLP